MSGLVTTRSSPPRGWATRRPCRRCPRALQLLRFDAAVLLAALVAVVGGDGALVAEADGIQPLLVDAFRHDVVAARLRALFRQNLVVLGGPHVVGVARDLDARALLVDHELGHRVEARERLGADRR